MAYEIDPFKQPNLKKLSQYIMKMGPTPEENAVLCVLAMMDEALQLFLAAEEYEEIVLQTYSEIEQYLGGHNLDN